LAGVEGDPDRVERGFFEYCFQVPANRIGFTVMDGYKLKIMQEVITLVVFVVFAKLVLARS
jgi:uncharacterized protein (DUF486 family)